MRSYEANWIYVLFANFSVFFCGKWVKILQNYSFVCHKKKSFLSLNVAVCRRSSEKYVWIALNTATSAGNRTTIPAAEFSPFFWNCRLSHLVSYLSYMFEEITLQRRKNSWWHESSTFCGNEMKATLREQSLLQPYGVTREFHHSLDINMTFVRVAFMLTCLFAWSGSHIGKKRVHKGRFALCVTFPFRPRSVRMVWVHTVRRA